MGNADSGSKPENYPVSLIVWVDTPTNGTVKVKVRMDASAGEFVERTLTGLGVDHVDDHRLEVPLPAGEHGDEIKYFGVDPDDTLLDSLRGLQHLPRIAYKGEGN